jgi:hypothetical protein
MRRVRITSIGSVAADVIAPVKNPIATLCIGLSAAAAADAAAALPAAVAAEAAAASARNNRTKRFRSCSRTANCTTCEESNRRKENRGKRDTVSARKRRKE